MLKSEQAFWKCFRLDKRVGTWQVVIYTRLTAVAYLEYTYNRASQKTSYILSEAKAESWKAKCNKLPFRFNHCIPAIIFHLALTSTELSLLKFCCWQKRLFTKPRIFRFQFRSSREPEYKLMNKLCSNKWTRPHPSTTHFGSFLPSGSTTMQTPSSRLKFTTVGTDQIAFPLFSHLPSSAQQ